MIHEFFEVFAAPVQMAEIPVEIRPRFRGGKLRRRFVERRDKGDVALECVAHGSVPFMRCSLGEPAGKTQRRGRRFAMARGTRVLRGECHQAMSGDGVGGEAEAATGGGVGVPCG